MLNNLKKIGIVSDEGADLLKETIIKHQIEIVPLRADWPEVQSLPGENIYQKMREAEKRGIKSFAKTSQPSPRDFLSALKNQLEKFEKVICFTITSKHSGTYNSAIQAKGFLPQEDQERVFIIDSLNASGGMGLLVLRAADLISEEKKNLEEIIKELEVFVSKIKLYVIFKDPKWAEASGRISHIVSGWIRRMGKVGVRPLLGFKDGKIKPIGIKTGAKDIPTALFREVEERTKELRRQNKKIRLVITHGDNLEEAQRLKEMIENSLKEAEVIFINLVDDIIGTLAGPDSLVVAWAPEDN